MWSSNVANTRSPEMWRQISDAIGELNGKKILDVGAGYCDLAIFAALAGARVVAIERDASIASAARARLWAAGAGGAVEVFEQDLERYLRDVRTYFDIVFCTSVLPYLIDPKGALVSMCRIAPVTILECQYRGDGPGFKGIPDDVAMKYMLDGVWDSVKKIGETILDIRPASRSIWMCEAEEKNADG